MPHYIHTYNIPTLILLSKTEETLSFLSIDDFEHNTGKPILPSTLCCWTNQPHNFRSAIISTTYIIIQASVYHNKSLFYSAEYGQHKTKRDSTMCTFCAGGEEQYGASWIMYR